LRAEALMTVEPPLYTEIVDFWRDAGRRLWFARDERFDEAVRVRFETAQLAAGRGDYADWVDRPEGALALVLLLDQFPRNLHRGSPQAFAGDERARAVASRAIALGHDHAVEEALRVFFYMPFEHSEHPADQDRSVALIGSLNDPDYLRYAELHRDLIRRFGRFPHRNLILGRESTPEEIAYLADRGFRG
jgi:uncharacterized protein (DUF924 family)